MANYVYTVPVADYVVGNNQANITQVGTMVNLTANGNITTSNGFFLGDGGLLSNIFPSSSNYANFAGNVVASSQPNITRVGNLSNLSVAGITNLYSNLNITGATNIGPIGNLRITGGSNGQVLTTYGNGVLYWGNGTYSNANVSTFLPNYTGNLSGNNLVLAGNINAVSGNIYFNHLQGNSANIFGNLEANNIIVSSNINSDTIINEGTIYTYQLASNANISAGNANLGNTVSANFAIANLYFSYGYPAGNLVGTIANANYANYAGNAVIANNANYAATANIANSATIANTAGNANYANYAGNVVINAQPNITSVGSLTGLTSIYGNFTGNSNVSALKIPNAIEPILIIDTGLTPTVNFDIASQSILYYTSNASTNWTVNFRGSNTTSLDTIMANSTVMTVTLIVQMGASGYYANVHQVDGSNVTVSWQGNAAISGGYLNSKNIYSYSIIKTGPSAFSIIGALTQFT
jgi:hypothetical protein